MTEGTILLDYSANTKQVEQEEQTNFLLNLFCQMGIPITELLGEVSQELDVTQRMKLRKILFDYKIKVIDDKDGGIRIYVDEDKVGEWFKSTYKIKSDPANLEKRKRFYLEMKVQYWSIFEEQNE